MAPRPALLLQAQCASSAASEAADPSSAAAVLLSFLSVQFSSVLERGRERERESERAAEAERDQTNAAGRSWRKSDPDNELATAPHRPFPQQ